VGAIPEDWEVSDLSGLAMMKSGTGITSRSINDHSEFPCFGGNGLRGYTDRYTHEGTYALIGRQGALCGNVVLARGRFFASEHAVVVTPRAKTDIGWLSIVLGEMGLGQYSESSAQPGLSTTKILKLLVAHPKEKNEQRAIAAALADADALIAALEGMIAKKRDLKQAAMQHLLTGKTRLPGFSGEWEVKRLWEVLASRPNYGINAPAVAFSDRLPRYIRITDITEDGRFSDEHPASVDSTFASDYLLEDGDLVFARTGASVGKSYLYRCSDGPLVFAGFLIRIKPDKSILHPAFLYALVCSSGYWDWVRLMSMRSGQPGINGNEYQEFPVALPPLDEQTAIAEVLSDMDADLAALEAQAAKARAVKQGMMQELLTGRVRLV
jgi:type I restriction enzyme S subunit